jgi:hypothetical protein
MSRIHFVSTDGATTSLQCYADDPDAEDGQFITFVDLGDKWDDMAAKVTEHQAAHGCSGAGK